MHYVKKARFTLNVHFVLASFLYLSRAVTLHVSDSTDNAFALPAHTAWQCQMRHSAQDWQH